MYTMEHLTGKYVKNIYLLSLFEKQELVLGVINKHL